MLLNGCPKKKCVTMPLANTAPYTSARIIIFKGWVKAFCKVNARKYMSLPLATLLSEASCSMENIKNLMSGGRLTLTSIPNVEDTLINLHTNVLIATELMIQRGIYSRPVKQHSRWRKK